MVGTIQSQFATTYLNINPLASPAEVELAIKSLASSGRVINPGPGTTTLLAYSRWP